MMLYVGGRGEARGGELENILSEQTEWTFRRRVNSYFCRTVNVSIASVLILSYLCQLPGSIALLCLSPGSTFTVPSKFRGEYLMERSAAEPSGRSKDRVARSGRCVLGHVAVAPV